MHRILRVAPIVALALAAACAGRSGRAAQASPASRDTTKKDLPWKPWAEVTKDASTQSGLFSVYLKRDKAYLAIAPDQFDRDYLLVTQLAQGIGDFGFDGGSSMRRPQ